MKIRPLLTLAALLSATPLLAVPPRIWMPLQSVGADWHGPMLQPLADGQILIPEYANGIKVDLNDFSASVPNGNGRLFVGLSQNAAFSGDACLKPNGTGCVGGTLFLGFEVHSATPAVGGEVGTVTVYLDSQLQKTLDNQSCKDANNFPTRKPAAEDRKIVLGLRRADLPQRFHLPDRGNGFGRTRRNDGGDQRSTRRQRLGADDPGVSG
ncbi:MAG TPA: hypothetical protein VN851_27300 [Thermoanaerobaculia bacterium]|nr:hypothetical protein [Thermoanaerobaculia bacterium]